MSKLNVLTACSGIGAPEHAWRDLPFKFIGCSEIEPFPSAVLKHHYPNVTNYGDMTKYRDWKLDEPTSIIFAGTPCQSFSVAGLRQGMASPNGNLALVFLGMVERFAPNWVVWENVPGVLSSNGGRDFGAFLGALGQLGFGYAYRTLDSQYFGVPQRRRRVFVVGYLGDWRRAAAVLFEPKSLHGDITKSRKTRQKVAPSVTTGAPYSRTGNERVEVDALVVNRIVSFGEYVEDNRISTLKAHDTKDNSDLIMQTNERAEADGIVVNRMLGFGDYVESDYTSTLQAHEAKDVSDIVMQPVYREKGHGDYTASDTTGTLMAQQGKRAVDLVTWPAEIGNTLGADWGDKGGTNDQHINVGAPYFIPSQDRVRRITCKEAERLQGFEPGYTDIEYRGKPAPDSQRYKALGNSMTVDVVKWIGQRIQMVEAVSDE
jgi:DNA (cytosine-5)-methyltransferase 1